MRPDLRTYLLALCVAAASPALAGPAEDIAAAKPVIDAVNADWIPAMQAKDAARVAEAYAPDAVNITRAGQVVVGHDAFLALMRERLSSGMTVVSGGLQRQGLTALGPGLLLEWGDGGFVTRGADGKEVRSSGPYTTVWKRGADGQWKIIRNMSL